MARRDATPEQKAAAREYQRRRYQTDPEFRAAVKARATAHYHKRMAEDPDAERAAGAVRSARYRKNNPKAAEKARRHHEAARARAKEFTNAIKVATPCADCGRYFPAVCMDFDHLDAGEKESCVGTLVNRAHSIKRIAAEVAKCEIVCACCHRLRTQERWAADGIEEML